MMLLEVYDAIVLRGAAPELAPRVATMREAFEARTGAFTPEDPWFEARSRAFWDDAITRQGFARTFAEEAAAVAMGGASSVSDVRDVRRWAPAFARAHRGLFVIDASARRASKLELRGVWSGAELLVDEIDDGMRDAL